MYTYSYDILLDLDLCIPLLDVHNLIIDLDLYLTSYRYYL